MKKEEVLPGVALPDRVTGNQRFSNGNERVGVETGSIPDKQDVVPRSFFDRTDKIGS